MAKAMARIRGITRRRTVSTTSIRHRRRRPRLRASSTANSSTVSRRRTRRHRVRVVVRTIITLLPLSMVARVASSRVSIPVAAEELTPVNRRMGRIRDMDSSRRLSREGLGREEISTGRLLLLGGGKGNPVRRLGSGLDVWLGCECVYAGGRTSRNQLVWNALTKIGFDSCCVDLLLGPLEP